MQTSFSFGQSANLRSIRDRLRGVFGPIRDTERLDATGQFVRSFIGSQTYDRVSWNAYARLRRRYADWEAAADASVPDIAAALESVTHAGKKAEELKAALHHIRKRAGAVDLEFLADLDAETAIVWLEQIHGVGRKIAAATLNFSRLRKRAFVADTHIIRVLQRFGFVRPNARTEEVYDAVMESAADFDADDLYELHWYLKYLGQKTCSHFRAACKSCALVEICARRVETYARPRPGFFA